MVPEAGNDSLIDRLLAAGLLPDSLVRIGIRRAVAARLREERDRCDRDRYVRMLRGSPIAVDTSSANEQHYEVPTEFFRRVLGSRLKYSCAWWPDGVTSLDAAEEAMLRLTCERARLGDGQSILELGCGWGSLTLWMAERYPNSRIVAVSSSATQKRWIDWRGFANVEVRTADMRTFDTAERFDRVVSVEMFEHMRNYEALMRRIASWLEPGGLLFVHVFSHARYAYLFEDNGPSDWMARYFFTGGQMPSHDLLPQFQDDLRLTEQWSLDGQHYQRTAEAWLANMDRHQAEVRPIFEATYGAENATRFVAYWRIFFMACAEVWGYRGGSEWGVSHYVFEPRHSQGGRPQS
jgi:cyclopropane-fatty-acyl-phospholipid synthase